MSLWSPRAQAQRTVCSFNITGSELSFAFELYIHTRSFNRRASCQSRWLLPSGFLQPDLHSELPGPQGACQNPSPVARDKAFPVQSH